MSEKLDLLSSPDTHGQKSLIGHIFASRTLLPAGKAGYGERASEATTSA